MSVPGLISVIMPAYNRQNYIAEAIGSILAQTAGRHEIIVIDDGSTDNTAAVARACDPSVTCHSQPNQGIGAALNHGLRHATGEWLAFLDSDDLWAPQKTAVQLAYFDAHPENDLLFGHYDEFVSPEIPSGTLSTGNRETGVRPGCLYVALMIRRETFMRVGTFSENIVLGHLLDWLARARALGLKEAMLPDVVFHRRIHPGNTTLTRRADYRDYLKVLKGHLDRTRATPGPA
ncbi:MAG: glycosyltransferase family 2 protein [Rariglobus sp.]|nr:glycosyltransferase family A protein [Rariglobus sp.]